MGKNILMIIALIGANVGVAQNHELGVFIGGSNYVGDIGPTNYINPNNIAYGVLYKWNRNSRFSYRASYTMTDIEANDLDSDSGSRQQRGLKFKNTVRELSAGIEFNFLDFDLHNFRNPITPYVYGGISYFSYTSLSFNVFGETVDNGNKNTFAIPMVVGVKAKIGRHLILGAEVGVRYALTDNLDGSNPENLPSLRFGNINSDDWYVFSGITLTYSFGRDACFYNHR
ncbi:DUF6089 family protein [Leptobacterium sp. I13]|uniref:type IX secretion system protein PorG n=1 Tax=Leptobacterium meishanense TaxID=3128904 RepID=UPI0030EEDA40